MTQQQKYIDLIEQMKATSKQMIIAIDDDFKRIERIAKKENSPELATFLQRVNDAKNKNDSSELNKIIIDIKKFTQNGD